MKLTPRDTYFGVLHAFADAELRVTGEENGYSVFAREGGGTESTDGNENLVRVDLVQAAFGAGGG